MPTHCTSTLKTSRTLRLPAASQSVAGAALLALGCGVPAEQSSDDPAWDVGLGRAEVAIRDGELEPNEPAIMALVRLSNRSLSLCTGTLIAPNLLLTAQHCVSGNGSDNEETVVCAEERFDAPERSSNLAVTPYATIGQDAQLFPVRRVAIPPGSGFVCGEDVALLVLDGQFLEDQIVPIEPELDQPARTGQLFSAVGYGDALDQGGPGVRRVRHDVEVLCGTNQCAAESWTPTEFVGGSAICSGDSGGPALDAEGRVVGVASRGSENCEISVYSAVYPWGSWIREVAEEAWAEGDYERPAWLGDAEEDPLLASANDRTAELDADLDVSPGDPPSDLAADSEPEPPIGDSPLMDEAPAELAMPAATGSQDGCSVVGALPTSGDSRGGLALGAALLSWVAMARRRRRSDTVGLLREQ